MSGQLPMYRGRRLGSTCSCWSARRLALRYARLGTSAATGSLLGCMLTRRSSGRFASGPRVPASLFDCAGVACLPVAQLGPAGLSTQARLRRQLLHEGGGDVTRRRPGGWPSRWRHRARSRSRSLGARRRQLAPPHDWRALLAAAAHWRRELFARLRAGPDGASGGLPATPLSRRASSTAPARHACQWCSSDRPACLHRRGFDVGSYTKVVAT